MAVYEEAADCQCYMKFVFVTYELNCDKRTISLYYLILFLFLDCFWARRELNASR